MKKIRPEVHTKIQQLFDQQIPLCNAMGVKIMHLSLDHIRIFAPLSPNINDKGTAFGGSLSAILTIAGWGLLNARMLQAGIDADLVIHRSEIIYEQPVKQDFNVYCDWLDEDEWILFSDRLLKRGRARTILKSWVAGDSCASATMTGSFVAIM